MKSIGFLIRVSIIASVVVASTGCIFEQQKRTSSSEIKKTISLGEPRKIIEGAKLNMTIPVEFFSEVASNSKSQSVHLVSLYQFVQKQKVEKRKRTQKDIEDENAATTAADADKAEQSFEFSVVETEEEFKLSYTKAPSALKFYINKKHNVFQIVEGRSTTGGVLLHSSQSADGNMVSLLIETEDKKQGEALIAIYFVKEFLPTRAPSTSSDFYYITGPGRKVRWSKQQPIEVQLCGAKAAEHATLIQSQINKWQVPLQKSQIKVRYEIINEHYPFSDLTQHCIQFVDDFLTEPSKTSANYGVTIPVIDDNAAHIIDGDVLLFTGEFAKHGIAYDHPKLSETLLITLLHELGHFFGLDHQFDGVKSIMSYDFNTTELTDYDKQAIEELYK